MSEGDKTIRVGSRKSELALIQTKHVIALLQKLYRNKKFEIHTMSTIGDRVLNVSLPKIGEKSLFTRDLEDALRNGGVDFVVHSLKDLPTALPTGMAIGAVLEREDARDALVLRESLKQYTLKTLPVGSVIGTSSLRRTAQIKRLYPHLNVCDIRGNLNTRLAKLDAPDSKFSGIILAQAGLVRMGWMSRISQVLEPADLLYAVGQGALAVECRANDNEILEMLRSLNCLPTTCRILAERSFLKTLGGGCSAPVAVVSKINGTHLVDRQNNSDEQNETSLALEGAVWSLNGVTEVRDQLCCTLVAKSTPLLDADSNGNSLDGPPPEKRSREAEKNSDNGSPQRHSPTVINDDLVATAVGQGKSFDLKTLIEKHIDLVKKCPVVGSAVQTTHENNTQSFVGGGGGGGGGDADASNGGGGGGGDADYQVASSSSSHCPLRIDVGQDFMGECPFVSNETKVSLANAGICPITHATKKDDENNSNNNINNTYNNPNDQVDRAASGILSSSACCPFQAQQLSPSLASGDDAYNATISGNHPKCPFLQKTIEMFDYGDEEKPLPKKDNIIIEDMDDLFCGLYQHKCFDRDLFVKAHELGQRLADNLIKKGALDVMRFAQAEIHSKIS